MNLRKIAKAQEARLDSIAARFAGAAESDSADDSGQAEVSTAEESTSTDSEPLAGLSEAERSTLIEKAEAGDATALSILEQAAGPEPRRPQGDAGVRGKTGRSESGFEKANREIWRAILDGRRRQTGR